MKHLKKLSVVLMLTTLFSVTFTSCIDNEVSPVVEAIYEAQADLIAAQAGVQNAEAALLLAQAQAEQAQAALTTAKAAQVAAITAGIVGDNAYAAARRVQLLLELVAQTNLDVADLQNDLAIAQVQFQEDLAAAIAQMKAAGVQIAVGYAWDYANAMQHANNLMSQLLGAKANLASAQLMQTTVGVNTVSQAYHLAQLQGNVTSLTADIANRTTAIAAMEAYIANPSTPEAVLSGLRAQKAAYTADLAAKTIEIAEQQNKVNALYDEVNVRGVLDGRFDDALDDHNTAVTAKNVLLAAIVTLQGDVATLTVRKASHAADLAAATTAVTTTTAAYNAAWTALGMTDSQGTSLKTVNNSLFETYFTKSGKTSAPPQAIAAGATKYATPANLQQVYVNARIDVLDATAELGTIEGEIAALYGALNTAINNLALAQQNYNSGIATITGNVTTAQTAVTTAQTGLTTAQSYYAAKKSIFEASPSGLTWFDQTTPLGGTTAETSPFPNTRIGNHADAIATSYAYVTAWVEAPAGTWTPTTLSVATVATIPVTASAYAAPVASVTIPSVLATTGYYVEVEADDKSETNAALLNDAVAKLGDNAIYDVAPALPVAYAGGSMAAYYLSGTDAYTVLYNAELDLLSAEWIFDNYDTALVAAQTAYDYQKNLFDNELTILDAAQAAKVSAITAQTAAKTAVDNAWSALGAEIAAGEKDMTKVTLASVSPRTFLTVNEVVYNAEVDKANLTFYNAAWIQGQIDTKNASIASKTLEIANIQPIINAKYAVVAGLLGELTAAGITYTFVVNTAGLGAITITNAGGFVIDAMTTYSDLHAELIAEYQALWALNQEYTAISEASGLNDLLITAYGAAQDLSQLNTALGTLKTNLATKKLDLEIAIQALASGQAAANAATANIAYLQALITTLEARHANTLAIAAKYKALMDAALLAA